MGRRTAADRDNGALGLEPGPRSGRLKRTRSLPGTVAAVDLGSNSFHLVVAQVEAERPRVIDRLSEMVRLASGLDRSRDITPPVRERALACLRRFGQRLKDVPPSAVRAVGTNTLRTLSPRSDFLAEAEAALGHGIEIISGVEEARLIYAGVAQSLEVSDARRLVVDIGGGSTEIIIGERLEPLFMESLYVGCVSVTRKHFPDGVITADRMRKAELAVRMELQPTEVRCRDLGWEEAIGTSGTFRAIDRLVRAAGWGREGITPGALDQLAAALVQAGHVDRIGLEGLSPERAAVLPGGLAVTRATLAALGIRRVVTTQGAMREGVLYDLIGRSGAQDIRERSVVALEARYHVEAHQAARVERTARDLLGQVAEAWGLTDPDAELLLGWAARLHEIGRDIAHSQYHRHGAYVLEHADLPGFSRQEQQRLAALVRAHRRKFPVATFKEMPGRRKGALRRLAMLLRLAVILHRGRTSDPAPPVELVPGKASLDLAFPEGWLDAHPLTAGDLENEAAYLVAADYRLTFR